MGSPEAPLNSLTILHKIIWVQDLSTGHQNFSMTIKLVIRESLRVFEKKNRERET